MARRLHPASLLFSISSSVSHFLWPALAYLVFRDGDRYEGFLIILFVPSVIMAVVKYMTYRYRLGDDELTINEGVLHRTERHIPYARIQNIELAQNIVHRLLRVADVVIETGSGREPEAKMRVLSLRAVDVLRERVFARRAGELVPAAGTGGSGAEPGAAAGADAPTRAHSESGQSTLTPALSLPGRGRGIGPARSGTGRGIGPARSGMGSGVGPALLEDGGFGDGRVPAVTLARIPLRELVLLGIVSNRGLLVIGGAWAAAWQFDLFDRLGGFINQHLPDLTAYERLSLSGQIGFALLVLLAILVAMRLLSIGWAVFTFHDFHLTRRGEELAASYGLLTRLSTTIPRRRVQLIQVEESLLHRLFRRSSVKVETAGASHGDESSHGREWLLPLVRRADLPRLLAEVQPEIELDRFDWRPPDAAGKRRYRNRSLIVGVLLGCVAAAAQWPWGAAAIPVTAAAALLFARLQLRRMAYGESAAAVAWRSGWWTRRLSIVRFGKIQAVQLERSPLDLRWDHALLRVDTANAGRTGHAVCVPYLPLPLAEHLRERWTAQADAAAFQW